METPTPESGMSVTPTAAQPMPSPAVHGPRKNTGIIAGVVVVALLIGGYLAWASSAGSWPFAPAVPLASESPSPSATPDPMAAWKTYTNTQNGFEFKYPPTWIVQDLGITQGGIVANPPDFQMPVSGTVHYSFSIGITAHGYAGDEQPVTRAFGTRTGYVYPKARSVYFPDSQSAGGYVIQLDGPAGSTEPDQILSTFKFTAAASTAEWKTYTYDSIPEWAFTIKYPPGWTAVGAAKPAIYITDQSDSEKTIALSIGNDNEQQLGIWDWIRSRQWPSTAPVETQFADAGTVAGYAAVEQLQTGTVYLTFGKVVVTIENGTGMNRKVVERELFLKIISTFWFTR